MTYVQREAEAILHTAQGASHADIEAANQRLHLDHEHLKHNPRQYAKLLERIRSGDHAERKDHPNLPTVFIVPGQGGAPDRVESWVQPVPVPHKT